MVAEIQLPPGRTKLRGRPFNLLRAGVRYNDLCYNNCYFALSKLGFSPLKLFFVPRVGHSKRVVTIFTLEKKSSIYSDFTQYKLVHQYR